MDVVCAWIQQRNGIQSDAMRPRVIGIQIQIASAAPGGVQQQSVVTLRAAGIVGGQVSEVCLRIGQIQNPALVYIPRRRADRIEHRPRCRVERAWAETHELRGIQFRRILDVNHVGSHVRCLEE